MPTVWTTDRSLGRVLAQSSPPATFPVPTSVPRETKLTIDGSTSMKTINQTLDEDFKKAFPGVVVTTEYGGTDAALKAVEAGTIDLAAIGRNLTPAEKAKGLQEVTIARHKIAMIVSPDNPFAGSLTIEQFARIFRGELKDWSEVGGPAGAIIFIDRPAVSDTRSAFQNYDVFQTAPFTPGSKTVTVSEDTTEAVIEKLGKNGIGYAIVDQVESNPQVKVLQMHKTLPDDPKYPFSQSLTYVYKGPEPNASAKAFLGFATAPDKQAAIEAARQADAGVAPSPETTTQAPATTTENREGGLPGWLWWLLLPLAALLAFFLLKGREEETVVEPEVRPVPPAPTPVPPVVPAVVAPQSRIILVPRNCKEAYAYWEVTDEEKATLRRQGGEKLALRIYDVTDIDLDKQPAHELQQYDCRELDPDLHVPIPTDDRDYLAELGYVTPEGNWLRLVRSEHVHVPACPPMTEPLTTAKEALFNVGGNVPDVLNTAKEALLGVGENVPETLNTAKEALLDAGENVAGSAASLLAGATALAAGAAVAAQGWLSGDRDSTDGADSGESEAVVPSSEQIIYVPRDSQNAYVYWEVSESAKEAIRQQGGKKLALRIYDLTDTNDDGTPDSVWQYDIEESDRDKQIPIHHLDREYVAELGYSTDEGRWLAIASSDSVFVPLPSESSEGARRGRQGRRRRRLG
jgi:phosphate transport system substrate-binding protein